ncbi:unnamed protein product [Euphydryas editha]|uniref:Uncharacterized protein n=1 Tax=Euphydryas editha TaxID=104508 RepID=A0AAU9USQ0_EUPED|nr:unnamed protein product [Euphydryas editha]
MANHVLEKCVEEKQNQFLTLPLNNAFDRASHYTGRFPGSGIGGAREGRPQRHNPAEVLELVEEDPGTSISVISRRTGMRSKSVHRILKRHELYPYHYQRVQTLLPRDSELRVTFCRTMLRQIREREQNPRVIRDDRSQYQFRNNLWTVTESVNLTERRSEQKKRTKEMYRNSSTRAKRCSTSPYGRTKRTKWSESEKQAVTKFFGNILKLEKLPSLNQCQEAIRKHKI